MASSNSLNPPLSTPHLSVAGRVFVITGGTQGLGKEIARLLKAQGAAGLVLASRTQQNGEEACSELNGDGCKCVWVQTDLSKAEDASSVIPKAAQVMKDVAPISGVVNAAATTARGNLFTTTADDFDSQMNINVRAPFLVTQAAAKNMIESSVQGASIVNIASCAAHGGAPFIMAYSAAKAALVVLTKNNAAELAPHKIRVNAINMGWTVTDNESKIQEVEHVEGANWLQSADAGVPLGRILRPTDVATTVVFLLSGASAMMTGSILELHPEWPDGLISTSAKARQR
jgi:NAD(P)-dependent dehydrogenase (short-subunit alcohol dehydrogenase family)